MQNYKGLKISLISRSNIRYEGVLENIDAETSTIALTQVRSFGTEGRAANPLEEIPPTDAVYNYICFRAQDVKDLHVIEQPPAAQAPPTAQAPSEPAEPARPQSSAYPSSAAPTGYAQAAAQAGSFAQRAMAGETGKSDAEKQRETAQADGKPRPAPTISAAESPRSKSPARAKDQTGDNQVNGVRPPPGPHGHRGRGRGGRGRFQPRTPLPASDFDFETANAKFNKDELVKEFSKLGVTVSEEPISPEEKGEEEPVVIPPPVKRFYDKTSSFFDDISCDVKERTENAGQTFDRRGRNAEERRVNMETFGQSSVDNRFNRYRGRGRGGFRGRGRGGYRGRGRGGYSNQQ
ncbi:Scd6-like Sm domain-containing protein [Paraphysoderma sedebokerense]|nr:Scd6-like Sm domain-containing protein [Paraphysoderma sedebokerense]